MTTRRKYPLPLRILHLLIAALVLTLIPVGLWMASRGAAGIFDTLTNSLYSLQHVTFEDDAGAYDQRDAAGFIKLNALRLRLLKKRGE